MLSLVYFSQNDSYKVVLFLWIFFHVLFLLINQVDYSPLIKDDLRIVTNISGTIAPLRGGWRWRWPGVLGGITYYNAQVTSPGTHWHKRHQMLSHPKGPIPIRAASKITK